MSSSSAAVVPVIGTKLQPMEQRTAMFGDFLRLREYSMLLAAPLSEEDCVVQSMPDASPIKWHLAHTTWFFETFVLARFEPNFTAFHPAYRRLFNSYYDAVGERHPRPQRGLLTRPPLSEIRRYRVEIEERLQALVCGPDCTPECVTLLQLGMQHEQQHQELMLTDIKHLLSCNPLKPDYLPGTLIPQADTGELCWHQFDASLAEIGFQPAFDGDFCFDNELPLHRQFVESFAIASRLVSNREYLTFVEQGGYADPSFWLAAGWDWRCSNGITQPLYWERDGSGNWQEFTLHGMQQLDPNAAVLHLSYFEADAYARWAGARLPTEAEWELAARSVSGWRRDWFGVAWQWTSSSYSPYPGYAIPAGAVGEYNGKFMVNQYVLRGASGATPEGHARMSYRNFFPATAAWQYSGIRLARSL